MWLLIFFSIRVFFQTLMILRTTREGRGPSFIPLYHFHPLKNIQTFICNFACEMTITCFQLQRLRLINRLLFDEIYHLIELQIDWFIDDAMFVCLLDGLILGLCYSNLANRWIWTRIDYHPCITSKTTSLYYEPSSIIIAKPNKMDEFWFRFSPHYKYIIDDL